MRILIAGDFCPKYRTTKLLEQGRYREILGEVKPIIEQADYSIVNLECPVVNGAGTPIPKCGPNLRTTTKAVDLIKYAGFKAVTLANNHFFDYGEEGVHDTLESLDNAGIAHVGGGLNLAEASKTMYIDGDAGKVAIINCCEHEFSIATETSAGSNPLNPVQQWYAIGEAKKQSDYVIVIVHGGHEHYQLPSPRMQELYRYFIDCGADAVINHHQHCFSGYEKYNGKYIVYGLGNFIFDHLIHRNGIWNEGYMLSLNLIGGCIEIKTIPYTQCGDSANIILTKERKAFDVNINILNATISEPSLLKQHHEKWMTEQSSALDIILSPYSNKFLIGACRRHWIPALVSPQRAARLLNFIDCEAHRDRVVKYLNSKLQ